MQCYRLKVVYNGTMFHGMQSNGNFLQTVEDCLELAVNTAYPGLKIKVHASGRTDAGVHATGQVVNIKIGKVNKACFESKSYSSYTTQLNKASSALKKISIFEERIPILSNLSALLGEVKIKSKNDCHNCNCAFSKNEAREGDRVDQPTSVIEESFEEAASTAHGIPTNRKIPVHLQPEEAKSFCHNAFSPAPEPQVLLHTLNSKITMLFGHKFPLRFTSADSTDPTFHSRFSAYKRSYVYRIAFGSENAVFENGRAWCVNATPSQFDMDRAREAARYFIGQHDFSAFRSSSCQASVPMRSLDSIIITRQASFVDQLRGAPLLLNEDIENLSQQNYLQLAEMSRGGSLESAIHAHTVSRPLGWNITNSAKEMNQYRRVLMQATHEIESHELEQALQFEKQPDPRESFFQDLERPRLVQPSHFHNENNTNDNVLSSIQNELNGKEMEKEIANSNVVTLNINADQVRSGSVVSIELVARSYVHSQVRKIVGAIYAIATNPHLDIATLHSDLVNGRASPQTSVLAPAEGLFLSQVLCATDEDNKAWIQHHGRVSRETRKVGLQTIDDSNENSHHVGTNANAKPTRIQSQLSAPARALISKYREALREYTNAYEKRKTKKGTLRPSK